MDREIQEGHYSNCDTVWGDGQACSCGYEAAAEVTALIEPLPPDSMARIMGLAGEEVSVTGTFTHKHEYYEEEFPIHCDGCGDSFSALSIIDAQQRRITELEADRDKLATALFDALGPAPAIEESQP